MTVVTTTVEYRCGQCAEVRWIEVPKARIPEVVWHHCFAVKTQHPMLRMRR